MERLVERTYAHQSAGKTVSLSGPGGVAAKEAYLSVGCHAGALPDASPSDCAVQCMFCKNGHHSPNREYSLSEMALLCMEERSAGDNCAFAQDSAMGSGWRACPLLSLLCGELRSMAEESADEVYYSWGPRRVN